MAKEKKVADPQKTALRENIAGSAALVKNYYGSLHQVVKNGVLGLEAACPAVLAAIGCNATKKRDALIESVSAIAKETARAKAKADNADIFEGVESDSVPFGVVWLSQLQADSCYLYSGDVVKRAPIPVVVRVPVDVLKKRAESARAFAVNLAAAAALADASEELKEKAFSADAVAVAAESLLAANPDGAEVQPQKEVVRPNYETEEKSVEYWDGTYCTDAKGEIITEEKEVEGAKIKVPKKHFKKVTQRVRVQRGTIHESLQMYNKISWNTTEFWNAFESYLLKNELHVKFNNYFAANMIVRGKK